MPGGGGLGPLLVVDVELEEVDEVVGAADAVARHLLSLVGHRPQGHWGINSFSGLREDALSSCVKDKSQVMSVAVVFLLDLVLEHFHVSTRFQAIFGSLHDVPILRNESRLLDM